MNADANELNEVGDEDEIATGATVDALDRVLGVRKLLRRRWTCQRT